MKINAASDLFVGKFTLRTLCLHARSLATLKYHACREDAET